MPELPRLLPSYEAYRALRSFASLDGVRCMSILPVIYHHAPWPDALGKLGRRGFLGVDMFFVLSGFLIVTLLLRERERRGEISLRSFYIRRSLRIMPLYYGIVLMCALGFGLFARHGTQSQAFFSELPYYLTYTTNWFPITSLLAISWSLSAEEQFYLLWPPIQKLVRRPVPILLVLIVLSQLLQFRVFDGWLMEHFGKGPHDLPMLYETTFTPILLGVLLAHVLHAPRSFAWLARIVGHPYASLAIYALLFSCICMLPEDLSGAPRLILHLVMTVFLASVVVSPAHVLGPVMSSAPVKRIGVLSYGMYLWHIFALHGAHALVKRANASEFWLFPVTLGLTLIIAELSYRFYETRFLRLKERFER
jgi:peptidoglycan/LPS O-acetylase OafA/YrhL